MGNKGFQARYEPRVQSRSCKGRNKAAISNLYASKQASNIESVHHRKTYGRIPVSHPE